MKSRESLPPEDDADSRVDVWAGGRQAAICKAKVETVRLPRSLRRQTVTVVLWTLPGTDWEYQETFAPRRRARFRAALQAREDR